LDGFDIWIVALDNGTYGYAVEFSRWYGIGDADMPVPRFGIGFRMGTPESVFEPRANSPYTEDYYFRNGPVDRVKRLLASESGDWIETSTDAELDAAIEQHWEPSLRSFASFIGRGGDGLDISPALRVDQ